MRTELVIALISAVVALASAGLTLWGQARTTRLEAELQSLSLAEQRRFEAERTTARYREPLARAAYDLQSRLYNILQQNLLVVYYEGGDERERTWWTIPPFWWPSTSRGRRLSAVIFSTSISVRTNRLGGWLACRMTSLRCFRRTVSTASYGCSLGSSEASVSGWSGRAHEVLSASVMRHTWTNKQRATIA